LLPDAIVAVCERKLKQSIRRSRSVSGGSINQAFRLETKRGAFFLKLNHGGTAKRMLATEARGLQALRSAQAIRIPEVLAQGEAAGYAYLLLEMVEPGPRDRAFWQRFGEELAALHRCSDEQFG